LKIKSHDNVVSDFNSRKLFVLLYVKLLCSNASRRQYPNAMSIRGNGQDNEFESGEAGYGAFWYFVVKQQNVT
jgi:hypothetical protein